MVTLYTPPLNVFSKEFMVRVPLSTLMVPVFVKRVGMDDTPAPAVFLSIPWLLKLNAPLPE